MPREIFSHKINGLNELLSIQALDEPGPGGANHLYVVYSPEPITGTPIGLKIKFQNGPLKEAKPNGLSNEALLAIVEDRLIGFQKGEFNCRENAIALTKIQEAMMWLQKRTRDRMFRGVEGTNIK